MAQNRNQGKWVAHVLRRQREEQCKNRDLHAAHDRMVSKTADVKPMLITTDGIYENLVCLQCGGKWKTAGLFELKHP